MEQGNRIEYYNRYQELQGLLKVAYVDLFSIKEIETAKTRLKEGQRTMLKSSYLVLQHIEELLKADLALVLCKAYRDDDNRTNTIKHLGRYIQQNIDSALSIPPMRLSADLRDAENRLLQIRNTALAHNDSVKSEASIELSEMESILEEFNNILNKLCFPSIDERVKEISDKDISSLQLGVGFGLGSIISKSMMAVENSPSQSI